MSRAAPKAADATHASQLARARAAYDRRAWADAYDGFSAADAIAPLGLDDLERFAWSAQFSGRRDDRFAELLERLHNAHEAAGNFNQMARAAFWLALRLLRVKELARASGWHARLNRLLQGREECLEHGYERILVIHQAIRGGGFDVAYDAVLTAGRIGRRFNDTDLIEFARNLEGRILIRRGDVARGLACLDEAMLATSAGRLSPMFTGLIFCSVIAGCQMVYDMERSREWTTQLGDWCEAQPQLGIFSGICTVHRAEIMAFGGEWDRANAEVERARQRIDPRVDPDALAAAHYQEGEIHRMRGEADAAEAAYKAAHNAGSEPQPGLALLRLQTGNAQAAVASIRQVLAAVREPLRRVRYLPAAAEIFLETGALEEATAATEELALAARTYDSDLIRAMASHAAGALALRRGQPAEALELLREALMHWLDAGAPYLAARIRTLIAAACRALGDREGCELECDAATAVFTELGARPDLDRLQRASGGAGAPVARHGLTKREIEVLTLVASGQTNKGIGRVLGLSEKTVDRHVSNILTKLDVPSRAAATAAAFKLGIIGNPTP